jgi:prepilin-type N-terminal cleavage/methylation domain-containing protein
MRTSLKERGFTLLEIMIVVAVVAILALILIPNFSGARAQAQTATCEANLEEIATAAELYYADQQQYPATGEITSATLSNFGQYLGNVPVDPAAIPTTTGGVTTIPGYTFTVTTPTAGQSSYTITCPGTHVSSTLSKLLNYTTTSTGIQFVSGVGLEVQ